MIADFYLGLLVASSLALGIFATLVLTASAWLWRKVSRWSEVTANKAEDGAIRFAASLRAKPDPTLRDGWLRRLWGWATRQGSS